jgi:hypothetical protein
MIRVVHHHIHMYHVVKDCHEYTYIYRVLKTI